MASCTRFYDAVILRFFIALYTMWCCAGSESVNSLAKFNTYVRTYVDMFFFNWGQFLMYYDSTSTYMPCSTYVFSTVPLFITPIVLFHIFRFQNIAWISYICTYVRTNFPNNICTGKSNVRYCSWSFWSYVSFTLVWNNRTNSIQE